MILNHLAELCGIWKMQAVFILRDADLIYALDAVPLQDMEEVRVLRYSNGYMMFFLITAHFLCAHCDWKEPAYFFPEIYSKS